MKEKIKAVIKRTFKITEVPDNLSQKNCEQWDSMNHLNLVVELESEFDISLEPEEIAEMKSLDDILKLIENKK
ncbi:MAG: acyl carrier protein [Bacteroidota bacterium]